MKLPTWSPAPTMSLMRLARVGGACSPSRVARRRCFSTMIPSISRRRAMSVLSGVIGMDKVAKRTRVDILVTKEKCKRWTAREHLLILVHVCASSREERGVSMMQNCQNTRNNRGNTNYTMRGNLEILWGKYHHSDKKKKTNPRYLLTGTSSQSVKRRKLN